MSKITALPTVVLLLPSILLSVLLSSCASKSILNRSIVPAESLVDGSLSESDQSVLFGNEGEGKYAPYLKAHMNNGDVYVLSDRSVDQAGQSLRGTGVLLNSNRDTLGRGAFSIPIDSIAIVESNYVQRSGSVRALSILTGISVGVTAYCIINPKACFGSCPTFYVTDGDSLLLQAEGFSSSIAPSLEARDVDALFRARPAGSTVSVEMRNEALETHVVRYVNLLVQARHEGARVLADNDGGFWTASALREPATCVASEGDCLPLVRSFDGEERVSTSDSLDLAAREMIELTFTGVSSGVSSGDRGLVIGARQTLLTTYVLYQTLAYMGNDVGEWFAALERNSEELRGRGLGDVLGGIEVLVRNGRGDWVAVDELRENGPLATDVHVIRLPASESDSVTVRLRLARGNWRLDYLALAELDGPAAPLRLEPAVVYRDGAIDHDARMVLLDSSRVLTTLPGDTYTLVYELPAGHETADLFLESRGYYLEWIREEWLADEDPAKVDRMLFDHEQAMRDLAPAYKKVEHEMEDAFWRSRYAKQQ